jgi:CheY-like chemotaxis protein
MQRSAALLCHDASASRTLKTALEHVGIEPVTCRSNQDAMELVLGSGCAALIADFDVPEAAETLKMAALLTPPQRPLLFAMTATLPWPGTGQAFQSGADRILYKPLEVAQVNDAMAAIRSMKTKDERKAARYEIKTMFYLELEGGTLPAIGVDISECGFAVQATEPIPMCSNLAFHCVLPGTGHKLHGRADLIWTDEHGRAGAFFSRITPASRKHLKSWLSKHGADKEDTVRMLMQPADSALHSVAAK